ncbi:carbonic anhydrase [Paenibacillus wulumuqiensis]|uniref:carbonic anhydrase n=1 Tax=Paenibacillus wulumuqiensis TaxID=1567107 RepID=UPI00069738E4|nr:carbonic anhydrase family protein [Paenibacillus wulumuqiensis]
MNRTWQFTALSAALLLLAGCGQANPAPASVPAESAGQAADSTTAAPAAHWSYDQEHGPAHWAELETGFSACRTGQEQSPIDIEHARLVPSPTVHPVDIHYSTTPVTVINNGHTIQVNVQNKDNYIMIEGRKYTLAQFHFHHPSEHQIDGKNAEMELHLVHKSADGQSAVLGILIHPGSDNHAFDQLWSHLPDHESEQEVPLADPIQLSKLLPADRHAVHYTGSLTTPPCTEHVSWTVLEQPIELSAEQIQRFATIFPDNHRPVQSVGSRELYTEQ